MGVEKTHVPRIGPHDWLKRGVEAGIGKGLVLKWDSLFYPLLKGRVLNTAEVLVSTPK